MPFKIIVISSFLLLQNIFFINQVLSDDQYIELDSIVAVAETATITKLELNDKKEILKKAYLQKESELPNDKEITKLALDQLITEKLVIEFAATQAISVSTEQLNNVLNGIAKSNNLSIEELIDQIENDGTSYSDFRESIRKQLVFDQVKKRIISANLKISEFEIDNFIELQKERTPPKYKYSHILVKHLNINEEVSQKKINKVLEELEKNSFGEIAIKYSDGPQAENSGLIGSFLIEDIPDIFVEPLTSMKVGDISAPIKSSSGYHLLKLNEIEEFEIESIVVKQTKAKQILLKKNQIVSEDEINKKLKHIRNMIIEGMSFSEAAEKYSEDGSASNKGDLGWLNPGDTIPEFEKQMDELELNEISQPVKTALGWHLIQVNDRRDKDLSSESLRQRVKENLLRQKTDIKFNDWVKTLREGAYVEIWLYED
jgi:peptidyl-prolyl cis-trans isomerase SurA